MPPPSRLLAPVALALKLLALELLSAVLLRLILLMGELRPLELLPALFLCTLLADIPLPLDLLQAADLFEPHQFLFQAQPFQFKLHQQLRGRWVGCLPCRLRKPKKLGRRPLRRLLVRDGHSRVACCGAHACLRVPGSRQQGRKQ